MDYDENKNPLENSEKTDGKDKDEKENNSSASDELNKLTDTSLIDGLFKKNAAVSKNN
jgi:hypothetical protein